MRLTHVGHIGTWAERGLSLALVAGLIFCAPAFPKDQDTVSDGGLSYTLTEFFGGDWEGNPPLTLYISQHGHRAVARRDTDSASKTVIFSDPDRGIRSASPASGFPLLRTHINPLPSLQVGDVLDFGSNSSRKVDSVRYSLERGDRDLVIEGRHAVHTVLSIELALSRPDSGDSQSPDLIHAGGTADFWTLPELPFSWIPYTAPNARSNAAIPLSETSVELSGFLLDHFSGQLEALGLMVRAEVSSRISVQYEDGYSPSPQNFGVRLEVSDLVREPGDTSFVFPSIAMISSDRYEVLNGMSFAAHTAGCSGGQAVGQLALRPDSDEQLQIEGEGKAKLVQVGGKDALILKSVASAGDAGQRINCALIVFASEGVAEGEYKVTAEEPDDETAPARVVASALFEVENESPRWFAVLESGALTLTKNGETLRGELDARGYRLVFPNLESSSLHEDIGLSLHFDIEQ